MKNCATCINLRRKCNGECGMCEHSVPGENPSTASNERTSNARPYNRGGLDGTMWASSPTVVLKNINRQKSRNEIFAERGRMIDASRERIAFRYEAPNYSAECKCMVCYDEDSGRYKYWEENKEVTRLLETGDKDD